MFDEAQYRDAIKKLEFGLDQLSGLLRQVNPTAQAAVSSPYMPFLVRDITLYLARKINSIGTAIVNRIKDLLKGAFAPIMFFKYAWDWQDIRGQANGVAGHLKPPALNADMYWKGAAAEAYGKTIKPQNDAITKIGTIAERTATSLTICAAAGLAFYIALGVIVVKLIAATITAIVALGSVVLSWAGALIIIEEAAVNTGMVIAAVSLLAAALGAQASQMAVLHGEAVDTSTFPGGVWPNATTGRYSDATVTDGDADWSLR